MLNGYEVDEFEDLESLFEDVELFEDDDDDDVEEYFFEENDDDEDDDDDSEDAERRRRGRRRGRRRSYRPRRFRSKVRGATGRKTFAKRSPRGAASQAQLRKSLANVEKQIKQNAGAISKLDGRMKVINRRQDSQIKKQDRAIARQSSSISKQGSTIGKLKKDLKKANEMAMLMPLLTQPDTAELTVPGDKEGETKTVKVMVDSGDSNKLLLPLLLTGSMGGGDGDSSNMLMLLALSGGL